MVSVSSGLNRGLVSWSLLDFKVGSSWLWLPSYVVITAFGSSDASPRVLSLGIQGMCTCSSSSKKPKEHYKGWYLPYSKPSSKGNQDFKKKEVCGYTSFACVCSLEKKEVCGYTNLGFGFPLRLSAHTWATYNHHTVCQPHSEFEKQPESPEYDSQVLLFPWCPIQPPAKSYKKVWSCQITVSRQASSSWFSLFLSDTATSPPQSVVFWELELFTNVPIVRHSRILIRQHSLKYITIHQRVWHIKYYNQTKYHSVRILYC